jgi:hypothetical protein
MGPPRVPSSNRAAETITRDAVDLLEERVGLVVIIALARRFQVETSLENFELADSLSHSISHHLISSLAS